MKKAIRFCGCIWMAAAMLAGCSPHQLKGTEYSRYVQNTSNGLKKVVTAGDMEYTIQYKPAAYIAWLESRGAKDAVAFGKRIQNLTGAAWFNISFRQTKEGASPLRYQLNSLEEYNQRLAYFLSGAAKELSLVYGSDTLAPSSYLFETNYNLTPQETMIVAFELPGKPEHLQHDMQLCYQDMVFKTGIIKATYTAETINNIPKLID